MLLFDELNKKSPIKIYNKYAEYPKLKPFKNDFFSTKANIYKGKTISPTIKYRPSMELELEHFCQCLIKNKKPTQILIMAKISKNNSKYKIFKIIFFLKRFDNKKLLYNKHLYDFSR